MEASDGAPPRRSREDRRPGFLSDRGDGSARVAMEVDSDESAGPGRVAGRAALASGAIGNFGRKAAQTDFPPHGRSSSATCAGGQYGLRAFSRSQSDSASAGLGCTGGTTVSFAGGQNSLDFGDTQSTTACDSQESAPYGSQQTPASQSQRSSRQSYTSGINRPLPISNPFSETLRSPLDGVQASQIVPADTTQTHRQVGRSGSTERVASSTVPIVSCPVSLQAQREATLEEVLNVCAMLGKRLLDSNAWVCFVNRTFSRSTWNAWQNHMPPYLGPGSAITLEWGRSSHQYAGGGDILPTMNCAAGLLFFVYWLSGSTATPAREKLLCLPPEMKGGLPADTYAISMAVFQPLLFCLGSTSFHADLMRLKRLQWVEPACDVNPKTGDTKLHEFVAKVETSEIISGSALREVDRLLQSIPDAIDWMNTALKTPMSVFALRQANGDLTPVLMHGQPHGEHVRKFAAALRSRTKEGKPNGVYDQQVREVVRVISVASDFRSFFQAEHAERGNANGASPLPSPAGAGSGGSQGGLLDQRPSPAERLRQFCRSRADQTAAYLNWKSRIPEALFDKGQELYFKDDILGLVFFVAHWLERAHTPRGPRGPLSRGAIELLNEVEWEMGEWISPSWDMRHSVLLYRKIARIFPQFFAYFRELAAYPLGK